MRNKLTIKLTEKLPLTSLALYTDIVHQVLEVENIVQFGTMRLYP